MAAPEQGGGTTITPLTLSNGQTIYAEATITPPAQPQTDEPIHGMPSMQQIAEATEAIATDLIGVLHRLEPSKGSVELGFQVSGSAGIPILAQGSAEANIKVTLEWDRAGVTPDVLGA